MLYHENLRRDLPNQDIVHYRHPPMRGITQRELDGLTSFLQLLTTIITWVRHNMQWARQKSSVVPTVLKVICGAGSLGKKGVHAMQLVLLNMLFYQLWVALCIWWPSTNKSTGMYGKGCIWLTYQTWMKGKVVDVRKSITKNLALAKLAVMSLPFH